MTARQQWGIVAAVVALLLASLWAATFFLGDELFPLNVGSQAPAFSAVTLDAKPVTRTLADYRGQVVLVNVWATWCEPCRVEMPSIERLHREYGPRGLKVVAISVDDPADAGKVRDFVREYKLTFQVLLDPKRTVSKRYQITGWPETFIIARDGTIRRKVIGAADWSSESNRALIAQLLGSSIASR
ncbi:MAG: TlpA family protein disulfide reductase [Gemmatimonadaceae bacterium]|nr:TlpA family protein disulfide reductase [Gemmatimonadaceae bacterium]